MAELNKVPGLFPKKTSLPASNTVSVRSYSLKACRIFVLILYLTGVFSFPLLASPCSPSFVGNPWNSQAEPRAFVTDSHTLPFTGRRPPYSHSRRRAWGQVQPGAQVWWRWWRTGEPWGGGGVNNQNCFSIKFQSLSQYNQYLIKKLWIFRSHVVGAPTTAPLPSLTW